MVTCCKVSILICWTLLFILCKLQGGASQEQTHFVVVENSPTGFDVGRIHIEGYSSNYVFINSNTCLTYFIIDQATSVISVRDQQQFDREAMIEQEELDGDDNLLCYVSYQDGQISITVEVGDVNDERPSFFSLTQPYPLNLTEKHRIPTQVLALQPKDRDKGLNGTTHFSITGGNDQNYFTIAIPQDETENSTKSRIILLNKTLNFEDVVGGLFNLSITISDMGDVPLVFVQIVLITVTDIEDDPPRFNTTSVTFAVREDHAVGKQFEFAQVDATSNQQGNNIFYSMSETVSTTKIGLNQCTGGLYLKEPLDYETSQVVIKFIIIASNPNTNGVDKLTVNVMTEDVNDEPPYFECFLGLGCTMFEDVNGTELSIVENQQDSALLQVKDRDSEPFNRVIRSSIKYSLEPEDAPLQIEVREFFPLLPIVVISLNGTVDREHLPVMTLILTAENDNVVPSLKTNSTITIRVLDINDNAPIFTEEEYLVRVFEGSPVGREILQVEAHDKDLEENGTVSYTISVIHKNEAADWFQISPEDGVISVASSSINYFAVDGSVSLNITATDNGTEPQSSSVNVVVTVIPSTTFVSNSYQEYAFDLQTDDIYFEFRTTERDGLLLYQQDSHTNTFSVHLQQGILLVKFGMYEMNKTVDEIGKDVWLAVSIQRSQQQITSLEVGALDSSNLSQSLLQEELTVLGCVNTTFGRGQGPTDDRQNSLYIGGVNIFRLDPNSTLQSTSFSGGIRNVVVGGFQLDLTCPAAQVNTVQGFVHAGGCSEMACTSSRSTMCVDYAQESYCQCLGGFSSSSCKISDSSNEKTSYAPIRFKGRSKVSLNLGYAFFLDLFHLRSKLTQTLRNDDNATGASGKKRIKRNVLNPELGEVEQELELHFQALELQDSILLNSRTATAVHVVKILESTDGYSYLTYSITLVDQIDPFIVSRLNIPLMNRTWYQLTATITTQGIILGLSGGMSSNASWGSNAMSLFAEEPQTTVSIGGGSLNSLATNTTGNFMGCIGQVSIDGIEIPLNGLLSASTEEGGFQVDNAEGVDRFCDLCNFASCPDQAHCISSMYGEVSCQCSDPKVLVNNTCKTPVLATEGITPGLKRNTFYIFAGSMVGTILVLGVAFISIIVVVRKRQEKKKARLYSINQSHMDRHSKVRSSNNYTPNTPKRRTSLTSSMNANCTSENHERSSISTFQEHAEDGDPENSSPLHHQNIRVRRKSCTSVESGIKMENDREMGICVRGIPQMDDSGHEVNSTDSARTYESDEIASSCYNDQLQTRPSISLKTRGASVSSTEQHTPRTPLTPREKKVMIPLRPPSINLSQSEYGDEEATDMETESFNTRVSSSSGMGGSMQNQGRGSDSENSKMSGCITPQWYHHDSTKPEKMRIQATRPYFPQPHHTDSMQSNVRPYPLGIHPPPMYHSPPTFSNHIDRNYSRDRSRSVHGGTASSVTTSTVGTDLPKIPRSYENYPQHFTISREVRSNGHAYDKRGPDMGYKSSPYLERQHSDPRVLDEREYTPTSLFVRQYSDPRIPRNGTYCIPRKHNDPWPMHTRQISDPRQSSQQTEDSTILPRGAHSMRHMNAYPSNSTTSSSRHGAGSEHRQYYTMGRVERGHLNYVANQQAARSFSSGDATANNEPYHTLNSLSKIDPISNWDAQDRMKIAVDHMDPCHLLSGPCIPFEYVSTDPSVVESQMTMDESMMGEHQVFESQGGGEGTADMLDPLDINMARLREDELDSILTDSEVGGQVLNHFPSADCSSQYTATIVAGSTSTSGESTPKLQKVFVMPPSQQSFDV